MTSGIFYRLCNERGKQEGWTVALGVAQLAVRLRLGGCRWTGWPCPPWPIAQSRWKCGFNCEMGKLTRRPEKQPTQGKGAPRSDHRATQGCHFKCRFLGPPPDLPEAGGGDGALVCRVQESDLRTRSVPFDSGSQPCSLPKHSLSHPYFKAMLKEGYFSISFAVGRHDLFIFV